MSGESIAEILFIASNISFALAVICFGFAIVFFIKFKISSVIGDLSGSTARKSIEQMRIHNEKTGDKSYRPGKINENRGKLTETMHGIGRKTNTFDQRPETGILTENRVEKTYSEATELLVDNDATGLLVDVEETISLEENVQTEQVRIGGMRMEMIEQIILIHTREVIT